MTGRTHPVPRVSRRSAAPHPGTPYAGRRARNTAPAHPPDRLERGVLGKNFPCKNFPRPAFDARPSPPPPLGRWLVHPRYGEKHTPSRGRKIRSSD